MLVYARQMVMERRRDAVIEAGKSGADKRKATGQRFGRIAVLGDVALVALQIGRIEGEHRWAMLEPLFARPRPRHFLQRSQPAPVAAAPGQVKNGPLRRIDARRPQERQRFAPAFWPRVVITARRIVREVLWRQLQVRRPHQAQGGRDGRRQRE
jgi:hypothetical protein